MLRELCHNLKCALVSLAIVAAAALLSGHQFGGLHKYLQTIAACELSRITDRQVQVGHVSGNLLTGIQAQDVAIAGPGGFDSGVVLAARSVRIHYNLIAVLMRQRSPAAAVKLVEVERPYARVVRDRRGRVNLVELFSKLKARKPVPPEKRFRGRIKLKAATLQYTGYLSSPVPGETMQLVLDNTDATIDFARLDWIRIRADTRVASGQLQQARLQLNIGPHGFFSADIAARGADVAWWYRHSVSSPYLRVHGGRADIVASFWSVPTPTGKPDIGYFASATVQDGLVTVTALDNMPVVFAGTATVTPEGVDISRLDATSGGIHLSAAGTLFDYTRPVVDIQFRGSVGNLRRLVGLLPADYAGQLSQLEGSLRADFDGSLVGPLQHADASLNLSLPDSLAIADEKLGDARLSALRCTVHLSDLARPLVVAGVVTDGVKLSNLQGLQSQGQGSEGQTPRQASADIGKVGLTFVWAQGKPLLSADLAISRLEADDIVVTNIRSPVRLAGRNIILPSVQAEVFGGRLSANAVMRVDEEGLCLSAATMLRDIDVAQLSGALAQSPRQLGGILNATAAVTVENGQADGVARLRLVDARYGDAKVDEISGLLRVEGNRVSIPLLQVASDNGVLWMRGNVDLDGPLDLYLACAQLDVGRLAATFGLQDIGGNIYLDGNITGTFKQPSGRLNLYVFGPRYGEFSAAALSAHLQGDTHTISVRDLLVARHGSMLKANVQLQDIDWQTLDAQLAGDVEALGLKVKEVLQLAKVSFDATGVAELHVKLGGTLRAPRAFGDLDLAYGSVQRFGISSAHIPFAVDTSTLQVKGAQFKAQEAEVSADVVVTSLTQSPQYVANVSARNIFLQDLAPLRERGLDLDGEIRIPSAQIRSTPQGPVGSGNLIAERIGIGGQTARNINVHFTLQEGKVELAHTELAIGRGKITSEGFYDWTADRLRLDLAIESGRLDELMQMAVPVTRALASGSSPQGQQPLPQTLAGLARRVRGTINGNALLSGSLHALQVQADSTLTEITLDQKPLPDVKAAFVMDTAGGLVRDVHAELTRGKAIAYLDGEIKLGGQLNFTLDASGFDLAVWRDWLPAGLNVGGVLGMFVEATGDSSSPQITCSIDIENASVAGASFDLVSVPILTIEEGRINIDTLILKRNEREIVADG